MDAQIALDWSDVLEHTEGVHREELRDAAEPGRYWLACQEDRFDGHQGPAAHLILREDGETKADAQRRVSVRGQKWDWLLVCGVRIDEARAVYEQ